MYIGLADLCERESWCLGVLSLSHSDCQSFSAPIGFSVARLKEVLSMTFLDIYLFLQGNASVFLCWGGL